MFWFAENVSLLITETSTSFVPTTDAILTAVKTTTKTSLSTVNDHVG